MNCAYLDPEAELAARMLVENLAASSHVSLTLFNVHGSAEPGKKVRSKIDSELTRLPSLPEGALFHTESWPNSGARDLYLVRGRLDEQWRKTLESGGLLQTFGKWENLALWKQDQIVLSAISHERLLIIHGEASALENLGLDVHDGEPLGRLTKIV